MKPSLNKNYNLLLELLHIIRYYQEMPSHPNKEESALFNFENSPNLSAYIPQNPLGNLFLMKPSLNKNYDLLLELLHIIRYYQEMPSHQNKERIGTLKKH